MEGGIEARREEGKGGIEQEKQMRGGIGRVTQEGRGGRRNEYKGVKQTRRGIQE